MPLRASRVPHLVPLLALTLALGACGDRNADANGGSPGSGAPEGATATAATAAEFSDADLEAYRRGLAREIELVKAAQAAGDTASTPQSRGAVIQAQFETATIPEGAKASALGDRYAAIRRSVHDVMRTLDMQGKIDGPVSIDTARASAEMKAQLAKDPLEALPASSAAALRARLGDLAPQWAEYVRLTAVAG